MPDLPTRADLFALGRAYVIQRAVKIDPAMVDVAGSDVNIVVGATSVMADHIVKHLGYRSNALLLDGAEGEDLDRYAWDRYQLVRKGAAPAVGRVNYARTSTAFGAGSIPIGTKILSFANAEYITTTVASFSATDLTGFANVRATVAGKASQVGPDQLQRFQRPDTLFDSTFTVTNPLATAHGEDIETDDDFRIRIRAFWKTARRGILAAIETGALSVPGISSAQAVEALTGGALPARVVNLYVADSTGIASAQIIADIQVALLDYRAGGIAVIIFTSIPTLADILFRFRFRANVDTVALETQIIAAVVEFVNSLPVNATLYLSDLYSVLRRFVVDGLIVDQGTIIAPVGDLVPTVGQTIRTTLTNVTAQAA